MTVPSNCGWQYSECGLPFGHQYSLITLPPSLIQIYSASCDSWCKAPTFLVQRWKVGYKKCDHRPQKIFVCRCTCTLGELCSLIPRLLLFQWCMQLACGRNLGGGACIDNRLFTWIARYRHARTSQYGQKSILAAIHVLGFLNGTHAIPSPFYLTSYMWWILPGSLVFCVHQWRTGRSLGMRLGVTCMLICILI